MYNSIILSNIFSLFLFSIEDKKRALTPLTSKKILFNLLNISFSFFSLFLIRSHLLKISRIDLPSLII